MSSTQEDDPRVIRERGGVRGVLAAYRRRLAQGDIGSLPVVVGLIVIFTIFQSRSDGVFLEPFNLVNLTFQMAAVGTISIGVVLVLLLGEIDLTAGIVSGVGAAVMAVVSVKMDMPAPVALLAGTLAGAAIGLFQGFWITWFRIPSFVVTLAGLMSWQGLVLYVLGPTGTVNLKDPTLTSLAGTFFKGPIAYVLAALFLAYVAAGPLFMHRKRQAAGLSVPPIAFVAIRAVIVSVLVLIVVLVLEADRGISSALVVFVGLVIAVDYTLRRTRLGRMIYAIGGNAEAARRAGIPVDRVRTLVFVLASALAAWGGILAASRGLSVGQSAGGGPVLLNAIAAAVVGGTSLFGGRGSVWAALLGIIVIQSISNGMDLLSLQSPIKYMVTGAVLLVTVTIDAVLRRGQRSSGR